MNREENSDTGVGKYVSLHKRKRYSLDPISREIK